MRSNKTCLACIFFSFFLCITNLSLSQTNSSALKQANKLYANEHYRNALPFYEEVLKTDPNNAEALYKSGICYLNRFSKEKALTNILKAYEVDSNVSKHIRYWMGRVYQENYEFEKAIECYNIYKASLRKKDQRSDELKMHLEQCQYSLELMKDPKDYIIKNLGDKVNSPYSEHSPVISGDGKTLYFTSRRKDEENEKEEFDGEPFEDIFQSKKLDDGTWSNPESIHLNSTGHDASVQVFDNDTKMLLYKFHKGGDIYYTELQNGKWGEAKPFANLNTKKYESSAFITADGKTLYFATNRWKKGDDLDIYYVTKDENGNWSKVKELKGNINTDFDDDAPYLTPDGKTMYFSSRGHKNMGGFDVFKSTLDENGNWSTPENLGHPINTPDDDIYYYLLPNGTKGYIASYRSGGLGEKDIYEVAPIFGCIVKGLVTEDVTNKPVNGIKLFFSSTLKTTRPSSATDISKDGGNYEVKVKSYNTYRIAVVKGNDTIKTETLEIPYKEKENEIIVKNIVIPYTAPDTAVVAVKTTKNLTHRYVFRNVYFDQSKSTLNDEARHELDIAAEILRKNPSAEVIITGCAEKFENKNIADQRAKNATDYLVSKGIQPSKIKINKPLVSSTKGNNKHVKIDVKLNDKLVMNFDPSLIPNAQIGSSFILRNVYFQTARYELSSQGKIELDTLYNIMMDYPNLKIELSGHTDDVGSDEANLKLSEQRAKAAMDYLVKKGIQPSRLSYKGYGESNPYVPNDSPFNRQLNRRTEAKIINR